MEREKDAKAALRSNSIRGKATAVVQHVTALRAGSCTIPITRAAGSLWKSLGALRRGNEGPGTSTPAPFRYRLRVSPLPTRWFALVLWRTTLQSKRDDRSGSTYGVSSPAGLMATSAL